MPVPAATLPEASVKCDFFATVTPFLNPLSDSVGTRRTPPRWGWTFGASGLPFVP